MWLIWYRCGWLGQGVVHVCLVMHTAAVLTPFLLTRPSLNPVPCTLHPQTLPPHTPLPLLTRPCERGVPLAKHEQFGVVRHDARGQLGCQLGTQEGAVLQVAVAAGAGAGASQLSGGCSTRAVAGAGAVAGAVAGAYKPCSHTPTSHIGIFEFNLNSIALLAWHSKTSFKP